MSTPAIYKNSIGQTLHPGDQAAIFTYSRRGRLERGVYVGVSPLGYPQVEVKVLKMSRVFISTGELTPNNYMRHLVVAGETLLPGTEDWLREIAVRRKKTEWVKIPVKMIKTSRNGTVVKIDREIIESIRSTYPNEWR